MNVAELKRIIRTLPDETAIFLLVDLSQNNFDDDGHPINVLKAGSAYREINVDYDEWADATKETNLIICVEEE